MKSGIHYLLARYQDTRDNNYQTVMSRKRTWMNDIVT
jgi:hypothetical protein